MKRKDISDEDFKRLENDCQFGGSGVESFKKIIGPFHLSTQQIDLLIKELTQNVSSSLENITARKTIDFLEKLKKRK